MAEETTTPDENASTETPELTLESVDTFDSENLSDEQKTFLEDNKSDLTPEQQTKFGIKEEEEAEPNPDDVEPEVRGTKKESSKKEEEEDPDEIDPDDEKTIGKVVKRNLAPVTEALKELDGIKNQNEVNSFIRSNPQYAKYEKVALKYMSHTVYKNIPVKNIMAIVAANDMQKLGAQKERDTARKVKETQGNGSQVRQPAGAKKDWATMSKADFDKEKQAILQQRR